MKRLTTIRYSKESDRQLDQLGTELGETASGIVARAVSLLWKQAHDRIHFDLAQQETGACSWCGWDAETD
ncbi:MAG: hypothetical protein ABIH03_16055 [Pseudomonadota bacterium]